MAVVVTETIEHLDFQLSVPCLIGEWFDEGDCDHPALVLLEIVGLCCSNPGPCCSEHRTHVEKLIAGPYEDHWFCPSHQKAVPMRGHTLFTPLGRA